MLIVLVLASIPTLVVLTATESIRLAHVSAAFGPGAAKVGTPTLTLPLVRLADGPGSTGCVPFTHGVAGRAVLLMRGKCDFYKKIYHAQLAGAAAAIIYNQPDGENAGNSAELITMTQAESDDPSKVLIPAIFVSAQSGTKLYSLANGQTQVALNETGEVTNPRSGKAALTRSLPGMRAMVSPFRQRQRRGLEAGPLTVALDRSLPKQSWPSTATARDQQGLVVDSRAGIYRPGEECSSMHGPRCQGVRRMFRASHATQVFASQTTQGEQEKLMEKLSEYPIIQAVAEVQLRLLLGGQLYRQVKATGRLTQQGVRYQVPTSVLPRYEVKGAGVAGVDGSYTAAQLSHYSGPAPYVQEMVAMRVFSKDPRNVPSKTGRIIFYRYAAEDVDAPPVAAAFPRPGKWVIADAGDDRHLNIGEAIALYEAEPATGPGGDASSDELLPPETGWHVAAGAVALLGGAGGAPPTLRRKEPTGTSHAADKLFGRQAVVAPEKSSLALEGFGGSSLLNVTLFAGFGCTGPTKVLTLETRELLCTSCFDVCGKHFDGSSVKTHDELTTPHSKISSMALYGPGLRVSSHVNCHGTWAYGDKMMVHKWHIFDALHPSGKQNNCVSFAKDDRFRPSHFVLQSNP